MTWTKRAGWVFLFVFVAFGCSGDGGGQGDEATGSSTSAVGAFCGAPYTTLTVTATTATASTYVTNPPYGWYIPDELLATAGSPTGYTATVTYYDPPLPYVTNGLSCTYRYNPDSPKGFKFGGLLAGGYGNCPTTAGTVYDAPDYADSITFTIAPNGSTSGVTATFSTGDPIQNAVLSDGNPCTLDQCNANGTASHTNLPAGTSCADPNICNGAETCNGSGQCVAGQFLPAGTTCSDGDPCNGAESCTGGSGQAYCASGTPPAHSYTSADGCTTYTCFAGVGYEVTATSNSTQCTASNHANLNGADGNVDLTVPTGFASSTSFIYGATTPLQTGVGGVGKITNSIVPAQAGVIRGRVLDTNGTSPLPNVVVTLLGLIRFRRHSSA